ncbi:MAG: hypothetical protein WCF85_10845 [Rhodospirillaceae bacterium]
MWLAHLRPVNINEIADIKETHLTINEDFAIFVGLNFLEVSSRELNRKQRAHILYLLRYGDVCEDSFVFAFEALEDYITERRKIQALEVLLEEAKKNGFTQ